MSKTVEHGAIRAELRPSGNLEIAVTTELTAHRVEGVPVLRVQRADLPDLVRAIGDVLHTPFAGALGARVQHTVPGAPRTDRERALLQRAFDLAGAIAAELPDDLEDAPEIDGMSDAKVAAFAGATTCARCSTRTSSRVPRRGNARGITSRSGTAARSSRGATRRLIRALDLRGVSRAGGRARELLRSRAARLRLRGVVPRPRRARRDSDPAARRGRARQRSCLGNSDHLGG